MTALALAVLSVSSAHAENTPKPGRIGLCLETGSRSSIGLYFLVHDRIAIRPAFTMTELKADNAPSFIEPGEDFPIFETTERVTQVGIGAHYLLTRTRRDTRPYFGLDVSWGRHDLPYQALENGVVVYKAGALGRLSMNGVFGLQADILEKIAVYGEAGLEYSSYERFAFGGKKLDTRMLSSFTSSLGIVFFIW